MPAPLPTSADVAAETLAVLRELLDGQNRIIALMEQTRVVRAEPLAEQDQRILASVGLTANWPEGE